MKFELKLLLKLFVDFKLLRETTQLKAVCAKWQLLCKKEELFIYF